MILNRSLLNRKMPTLHIYAIGFAISLAIAFLLVKVYSAKCSIAGLAYVGFDNYFWTSVLLDSSIDTMIYVLTIVCIVLIFTAIFGFNRKLLVYLALYFAIPFAAMYGFLTLFHYISIYVWKLHVFNRVLLGYVDSIVRNIVGIYAAVYGFSRAVGKTLGFPKGRSFLYGVIAAVVGNIIRYVVSLPLVYIYNPAIVYCDSYELAKSYLLYGTPESMVPELLKKLEYDIKLVAEHYMKQIAELNTLTLAKYIAMVAGAIAYPAILLVVLYRRSLWRVEIFKEYGIFP